MAARKPLMTPEQQKNFKEAVEKKLINPLPYDQYCKLTPEEAEKIADAVEREISQVKDSRVIISEHMAYVSVEIDKTAEEIIAENTIFLQELPLEKLITIAEKELVKVYGKRVLKQRPWKITRSDEKSITLTGTFHDPGKGGVAEITLQKSDGKVLRMIHGK